MESFQPDAIHVATEGPLGWAARAYCRRNGLSFTTAPDGKLYTLGRNTFDGNSELAGAVFAPDGQTLFVNIQNPGITLAVKGPWGSLKL